MERTVNHNGLTKREVFSIHAMQALLSNPSYVDGIDGSITAWVVGESVRMADELLAELDKQCPAI